MSLKLSEWPSSPWVFPALVLLTVHNNLLTKNMCIRELVQILLLCTMYMFVEQNVHLEKHGGWSAKSLLKSLSPIGDNYLIISSNQSHDRRVDKN